MDIFPFPSHFSSHMKQIQLLWRWRQHVPPKRRNKLVLHHARTPKSVIRGKPTTRSASLKTYFVSVRISYPGCTSQDCALTVCYMRTVYKSLSRHCFQDIPLLYKAMQILTFETQKKMFVRWYRAVTQPCYLCTYVCMQSGGITLTWQS
jgi:hypothetical protein